MDCRHNFFLSLFLFNLSEIGMGLKRDDVPEFFFIFTDE